MAVSNKDIEALWKRYSTEYSKNGISVAKYFEANGVPYHAFERWYKKKFSQPNVVDCVVSGVPDDLQPTSKEESMSSPTASKDSDEDAKIISYVYVVFNDGMKIEHHKLSYSELVSFIKRIQTLWNVRIIKIV